MSAGTVKIKGVSGVHRSKRSTMRVYARRKTSSSNRLERRAHNLMNSEPGRLGATCKSHKERSSVSERTTILHSPVPVSHTKRDYKY